MKFTGPAELLFAALSKARAEFPPIEKGHTADTGKFTYDYADHADILEAITPSLSKHGLAIIQDVSTTIEPPVATVTTFLVHESGAILESSPLSMPCSGDPGMGVSQKLGSAESYARRYSVLGIVSVQPKGEDDDGNGAGSTGATTGARDREPLPACPACGKADSTIVGKKEYGGGLVCFKKRNNGCGHTWGTDAHPLTKHDDAESETRKANAGNKPANGNGKTVGTQPAEEANPHYPKLQALLREIGCKSVGHADRIAQWVFGFDGEGAPLVGAVAELSNRPDLSLECYTRLVECQKTMPNREIMDAAGNVASKEPAAA